MFAGFAQNQGAEDEVAGNYYARGKDIDKLTLEEHTKFSKMYAAWKVGNIEKL